MARHLVGMARRRRFRRIAGSAALLLAAGTWVSGAPTAEAADTAWTVVELPPLPGASWAIAGGVDNLGRAVGLSDGLPVRWSSAGTPAPLPLPAACDEASLGGMNLAGDVVGTVTCPDGPTGVRWPADGGVHVLATGFEATGLNHAASVIMGVAGGQAALWISGYGVFPLPVTGCSSSSANGVNDAGLVVGSCTLNAGGTIAIGWYRSYVFPLLVGVENSAGQGVTDSGVITVRSWGGAGIQSWLLTASGATRLVPAPGQSAVFGINEHGIAVGFSGPAAASADPAPQPDRPSVFVYGSAVTLDDLVPEPAGFPLGLGEVDGINDRFEMVGWTRITEVGDHRAWLLRPPGLT